MRIKSFVAVLTAASILFFACNRSAVSLTYTNAKDEVPQLGNLIFRFNQPMVADSLLNQWDSTDYVQFSPNIPGRFRWESPDQLVFSPAAPLDPATTYTANVSKAVLRFSEYGKVENGDGIKFHTPDLRLDNSQTMWVGESATSAVAQIDLYFNYRVSPADIKDKLQIKSGNEDVPFSLITAGEDNKMTLRLTGLKAEDRDYPVQLVLAKGLKPVVGKNGIDEPISTSMIVPSPFVVQVTQTETEHNGEEGVIRISTSQQLSSENIKSFIAIDPSVNFTTEITESGLNIRSTQFNADKSYTLTLKKGLRGKLGGTLKEEYQHSIAFGQMEASINFTNSKAVYLSRNGGQQLEVKITNVPKIKVIISKIYESNLLAVQRYGYYARESYRSDQDYYDEYYYEDYYNDFSFGDVMYEKEIDTRSLPKSAGGRLLNLSQFEDRLPDFKGVYHISIRSTDEYWVRDSRFISISDLGLIAKQGKENMMVFVNSIKTAKALSGVNILVYGNNNQLLGTGASNEMGVAEISYARPEFSGFKPAMVIARTADDFNYLPFRDTRVNTSRFDVGGKRMNDSGIDAYVYPERDIYRPGEKINFAAILRDRNWQSPGNLPVKLRMLLPNGKELTTIRKTLNDEGSAEASIALSAAAITGSYTLELFTSNDVLLTSRSFSVEEFVPDRIRVNTQLNQESFKPGETAVLKVNAMNFFGPPAANRNIETEIQVRQRVFNPEKFSGYNFALANQYSLADKEVKEDKTDTEGNATVTFKVPDLYANMGLLQATFYSTVFDETGRPVSRASSAEIYTQDVFYGIQQDWSYYFPLNQKLQFGLVAVNKKGEATTANARVEVIKHEYRTVLARSGSYFRYESQKEEKMLQETQVAVGSNTSFSFIPRSPGDYEIRVYKPGASTYVSRKFYSYGSWGGDNNSFEVNAEGQVEIKLEKESYLSGETVKALFSTPFNGRLLVTMETDHVLSYQYVDVVNRSASVDLPLSGKHVPNVYITATLIKAHEQSDIPLTVANGFKSVKVEEKADAFLLRLLPQKNQDHAPNRK
ncbi:MAG: MG2 domain-containing protein [Chitinophagaceae bacterium]|nr:MG2 domain-containing protein [Chitinophagaceae bacterium]